MSTAINFPRLYGPVAASLALKADDHVSFNSAGDLIVAADVSGSFYAGTCASNTDNSAGIAAALSASYLTPRQNPFHTLLCSGADKTWNGKKVFWTNTPNTVALIGTTTYDICAGTVVQFVDATHVIVDTVNSGAFVTPA